MKEVLNDTHDQEDHGEAQTGHSKNAKEGQAGFTIEHGDQTGNSIGNPFTNGVKNIENSIKDSGSSLQKHTFQHKINILTVVHYGYIHWLRPTDSNGISRGKA